MWIKRKPQSITTIFFLPNAHTFIWRYYNETQELDCKCHQRTYIHVGGYFVVYCYGRGKLLLVFVALTKSVKFQEILGYYFWKWKKISYKKFVRRAFIRKGVKNMNFWQLLDTYFIYFQDDQIILVNIFGNTYDSHNTNNNNWNVILKI